MKRLFYLLFFILLPFFSEAQVSGTVTVPGTYPDLATAIADLNISGISGNVVVDITAPQSAPTGGYILGSTILNATVNSTNTLTINGGNNVITPATGTTTINDAVFRLAGTDYVTLNQLNIVENVANTTTTTQMERGIWICNLDATDACKNVTIQNCTINLNGIAANAVEAGILVLPDLVTGTLALTGTPSAPSGTGGIPDNIVIKSNTVTNCYNGIYARGNSTLANYISNLTIGGNSSTDGNTVTNIAGGSTTIAQAIYASNITNDNYSNNTVSTTLTGTSAQMYGIFTLAAGGARVISNNDVSLVNSVAANSSALYPIYNTGASTTLNMNDNYVHDCSTAGTGLFYAMYNASSSTGLARMNSNLVTNCSRTGAGGTFWGIYSSMSGTGTREMNLNTISNLSFTTSSTTASSMFLLYPTGSQQMNCLNNTVSGVTISGTSTGSQTLYGIYNLMTTNANHEIQGNKVNTISCSTTTCTMGGIYNNNSSGTFIIEQNNVNNISATGTAGQVRGMSNLGAGTRIIRNNFISNLRSTAVTVDNAILGIECTGGTNNLLNNTIHLGSVATLTGGTNFGVTGFAWTSGAASVNLQNNIINVKATPSGTGVVAAMRYLTAGTTGVVPANLASTTNNNILHAPIGTRSMLYAEGALNAATLINAYNLSIDPNFNTSCGSTFKAFMAPRNSATTSENNLVAGPGLNTFIPSGASNAQNAALPLALVTDDFDGNARSATPDIGALEFVGPSGVDVAPPLIVYPNMSSKVCLDNATLVATITDLSGVDVSATNAPRVYYKKTTDANALVGNTSGDNGWKWVSTTSSSSPFSFTLDYNLLTGPVVPGDTIQYFVIAQDLATNINIGTNSALFPTSFCPSSVNLYAPSGSMPVTGFKSFAVLPVPTTITATPATDSLCFSGSVNLATTSFGTIADPSLVYQWQSSPLGANTWTNISGANGVTNTIPVQSTSTDYRLTATCPSPQGLIGTSTTASIFNNNPILTSATTDTICGTASATLQATTIAPYSINWYNVPTGGAVLGTGSTFNTPIISSNTTFYAEPGTKKPGFYLTTFAGGNSASGNAFPIKALTNLTIDSFAINCNSTLGTLTNWTISYAPSDYLLTPGANTNAAFWTVLGTVTGVPSAGVGQPTKIPIPVNIDIPVGQTYSFQVAATSGGVTYTNGTTLGALYSANADLEFYQGHGGALNSMINAPRVFNGHVYYRTGCAGPRTPLVVQVNTAPAIAASNDTTVCWDGSVSVPLTVSSANAGYTYSWSPAAGLNATTGNSVLANPLTPTNYVVTANDLTTGCQTTDTVAISVSPQFYDTASANVYTICAGQTVNLAAGDSIPPLPPYCLSNATNPADTKIDKVNFGGIITGSSPTTQETYTDYTSVIIPVTAGIATPLSIRNGSASLNHYTAYGKVFIDYNQNNVFDANEMVYQFGPTTALNTVPATNITIPTTALNGNTRMRIVLTETTSAASVLACGTYLYGETEDYTINISGATPKPVAAYTYSWMPGSLSGASQTVTPTATTTYVVSQMNVFGCKAQDSVSITVNPLPSLSIAASPNDTVCAGTNVLLQSGAVGAASITWNGVPTIGNDSLLTPANSGVYTVVATTAAGCSIQDSINILVNQYPTLSVSASPNDTVCFGTNVLLQSGAIGATSVNWNGVPTIGNDSLLTPATSGVYHVVASNLGCSVQDSILIHVIQPIITASPATQTICAGATTPVSITASGANAYVWNPTTGLTTSGNGSVASVLPSSTTTYQVTGTDNNGCTGVGTATVLVESLPLKDSVTASPAFVCYNSTSVVNAHFVQANPPGFEAYSFAVSNGVALNPMTTSTIAVGSNEDDTYTSGHPIGFPFKYKNTNYTTFGASSNGFIVLGGSGGSSDLSNGFGTSMLAGNTPMIAPWWDDNHTRNGAIKYTTVGTAPNRICIVDFELAIRYTSTTANTKMQVWLHEGTNKIEMIYGPSTALVTPVSGSIGLAGTTSTAEMQSVNTTDNTVSTSVASNSNTVMPVAGTRYSWTAPAPVLYTYAWTPAASVVNPNAASTATTPILATKKYYVTATSPLGCKSTDSVTVSVNPLSAPLINASDLVLCNGDSSQLSVALTNGGLPYTYSWTPTTGMAAGANLTSNPVVKPTSTTTYTVSVSDACNTTASSQVTIAVYSAPSLTLSANDSILCYGQNAILTANGIPNTSSTTVTVGAMKDNTIYQENPDYSNGKGPNIVAGRNGYNFAGRALLAFDLSSIPPGATITSATMTLNCSNAGPNAAISQPFGLHKASQNWGEGNSFSSGAGAGVQALYSDATWLHAFTPSNAWTNPGGDFVSTASATTNVTTTGSYSWSSPSMVADIQSWIANPSANYGWLLKGQETNIYQARRFDSRENAVAANRPKLTLTYTVPAPSYSWSPVNAATMNVNVTPLNPTTYTVTYVDSGSGCSNTKSLPIDVIPQQYVVATSSASSICNGTSVALTAADSVFKVPFCKPTYITGTGAGDFIDSVGGFGGLLANKTGAGAAPYYQLFPTPINVTATTPYTVSVRNGSFGSQEIGMWIDYNHDSIFSVAEQVGQFNNVSSGATVTFNVNIPATAYNGPTLMRVMDDYTGPTPMDPCRAANWGETEDYILNISGASTPPAPPVYSYSWMPGNLTTASATITPTASSTYIVTQTDVNGCTAQDSVSVTVNPLPTLSVSASPNDTVCAGTNVTLLSGAVGANSYTWNGISTAGPDSLLTPAASGMYTVVASTSAGCTATGSVLLTVSNPVITGLTATPSAVCNNGNAVLTVSPGLAGPVNYCNSAFTNVTWEHITNVSFGTINNSSVGNTGGPVNYTSQTANVTAGSPLSMSVTILPDAQEYIYAWIDWNQNGTLNDAGEQYVIASSVSTAGPHTISITPPLTAINGPTRMRVMVDYANSTPNPCRTATYGEAEDYTVNVTGGVNPSPAFASVVWSPATNLSSTTLATVNATALTSNATYTVQGTDALGCTVTSSVTISVNPAPVGNTFSNPIVVNALPYIDTADNMSANCWTDAYAGIGNRVSPDVFYRFTMPGCNDSLVASLCGGATWDTYLHLLDSTGTRIAFNDDGCSAQSIINFGGMTKGGTYYIVVEGFSASSMGTFVLNLNTYDGASIIALAPSTSNQTINQPDASTVNYRDANCNLISTINDGAGGNVLGTTLSTVNIDPTASFHNGQPFGRRWYQISPSSNGSATVTLYFNQSDFDNLNSVTVAPFLPLPTTGSNADPNIANIRITKNDNAGLGVNPVVLTPTSVNWNGFYWEVTVSVPSFSQFRVHSVNPFNAALPVSITKFEGYKEGNVDVLEWITANETNNSHFNLQRSADGQVFENLGRVTTKAQNGNSSTELSYRFVDAAPMIGHNYYRLEQVDLDQHTSYSRVIDLYWGANGSVVSIYPNPTKDILNIDLSTDMSALTEIKLLDMSGRVVKSVMAQTVKGLNNIKLSLSEVASGVYGVQIFENNKLTHVSKVRKND